MRAPPPTVRLLKRVGPVWYRLRIAETGGKVRKVLDAGVRCADRDADWVRSSLQRIVAGLPPEPRPIPPPDQLSN